MDYRQFIQILRDENPVPNSIGMLTEFANEFPYFQTAHSLLAREMFNQQHVRYERQLKVAAAYSPDRKALYNLIHPKKTNLFSTEPVVEHPHLSEETAPQVSLTENLFEIEELNDIIPPDNNTPPVFVLPVDEKSEEINPASVYREEMFQEETETMPEEESPIADPHEIIRKRLNEILGLHQTNDFAEKEIIVETTVDDKTDVAETYTPALKETPEENKIQPKDIIDQLADESVKAVDDIDRGELEYALEASLIQSLEKLPLIEKAEPEKEAVVEPAKNSFIEWLKSKQVGDYGKIEEVHAYDETPEPAKQVIRNEESDDLIDRFIKEEPKIVVSRTEFYSPSIQARKSITQHEDIVSETLARIYHQQGNIIKARESYEKLSLLYPEKKAYFAALISAIDQEINQHNKEDL